MRFHYKARNSSGALVQGNLEAESRDDAVKKILRDGLVPLDVDKHEDPPHKSEKLFQKGKPRLEDLADFLRRFSDLIEANIPLVRALQIVEKRTGKLILREAIGRVLIKVQDGTSLSAAIASEPGIFPSYWPGLIYAGELSGQLKEIIGRLSRLVEKELETRSRLISGAIYPLLILCGGIMAIFFLLTFVVPKLSTMFTELGQNLPLITRALLALSAFLARTWWIILLGIVFIALWIKQQVSSVAGRILFEKYLVLVPFWGEFLKTDDMERLARTVGILLESGVETVSALECGAQTLKREIFKAEMRSVIEAVRQGTGMSRAFSLSPIFSEDVLNMINVGEESGKGYQGFLQWAQLCDRQLERMTKIATALLEPALILLIGGIVAFIVMALLLPIFEMSLTLG